MADPRLLLIVTVAFVLEAALGFGSSVIVATLGALLGPLDAVMPAFITVNLALSAWVVATARANVNGGLLLREVLPLAGLGVLLGFVLTWWVETRWLHGRVGNPTATATTASGVVVPALFLVGALAGYAFGERGGKRRLKLLGTAAGLLVAVLAWALLVVTR